MSSHFRTIFIIFIDIVYKYFIFLTINFVIKYWKSDEFEMGTDLVETASLRGDLD